MNPAGEGPAPRRRPPTRIGSDPGPTRRVVELLDASVVSAAVGAALELGLLWLIDSEPLEGTGIAAALGIPAARCATWLGVLERAGLVASRGGRYVPGHLARTGILPAYSRETWGLLAEEARERRDQLVDLPGRLRSGLSAEGGKSYVERMRVDPERARRFTRMLYELHGPLADALAARLDLDDVHRLLDLGGGSGVVSMALARRHPALSAVAFDLPNVCAAGREIVADRAMSERVAFLPGDLDRDPLPAGFDMVLECDVGIYDAALFARVRRSLLPGGRFLVVDHLDAGAMETPQRIGWALVASLRDQGSEPPTADGVVALMRAAGFDRVVIDHLPSSGSNGFSEGMTVIEAAVG